MQITISDQLVNGAITRQMTIEFLTEKVTLRDLIKSRVYQEVKDANVNKSDSATAMFQLSATETTRNEAKRIQKYTPIEFQMEYDRAIDAFLKGRYFVLVDDQQPVDLDEVIVLHPDKKISFVKLIHLAGG